MNATHLWKWIWVGEPRVLWKRRLILGVLEGFFFLVLPFMLGDEFGELLIASIFSFILGAPPSFLSFQLEVMIFRWWVATAVFLPLILNIRSSITTRRSILRKSPILPPTKIAAKAGCLIPLCNCIALWLLGVTEFGSPGVMATFLFSLYHTYISFEGRWFRALDFRGTEKDMVPSDFKETPDEFDTKSVDWTVNPRENNRLLQAAPTLWKRRLLLSVIECVLFLGIPIIFGWGPESSVLINSSFYIYIFNSSICSICPEKNGFQIGGSFASIIWQSWMGQWWLATSIFLPVALGVISSIATRRDINKKVPISWYTRISAKVAVALPFLNTMGLLVYWGLSFLNIFRRPCGNCSFFRPEVSLFVSPLLVFICTLFHMYFTFEGRWFRAWDFLANRVPPKRKISKERVT